MSEAPTAAVPVTPAGNEAGKSEAPIVSGPSFLGLNEPPPKASGRGNSPLSIDPSAARSRNLDYLLEDDEPPKRSGGKIVMILVALVLAAGLGYLRWRNQGFGWLGSSGTKPAATAPAPDTSDSGTQSASTSPSPNASSPSSSTTATPPNAASPTAASPVPGPSATNPASPPPAAAGSTPPAAVSSASAPPALANPPASSEATQPDQPSNAQPSASHPAAPTAVSNSSSSNSTSDATDSDQPNTTPVEKPQPSPEIRPAKPLDTVAEAQKYIYGRGVTQNCDRGLKLLKPAADRANPKAMAEMGALYSAGLCTPRDLPTAYRWFAMALRKDPDNQSLQSDLEKLWGEMTQPERQQAMRLTQ